MDPAVEQQYRKLAGKMSEAEFLQRIDKARGEFGDLLDDEALALLVLDELGFNEGAYVTIDELPGRAEATVRGTIARIDPPRTFQREGRPEGRVCNLALVDATGEARVVLWDRDVEKTEDGTLRAGARATFVNVRVKEGRFGLELHVGPWSVVEVEGALDPAKRKLLMDVMGEKEPAAPQEGRVEGALIAMLPTRSYQKTGGGVGFVAEMDVESATGRVRVTLWDEAIREARKLTPGARVAVDALEAKARGSATEWHTTPRSKIIAL